MAPAGPDMGGGMMAGPGMAPKDPSQVRRRNLAKDREVMSADGRTRGPRLPEDGVDGECWHPRTKAWWDTWRRSAQAAGWTATDWDFLLDTALMHHVMWSKGKWEFASELRLRVAKFGATPEDRARLRIEVESGGGRSSKPKPVVSSERVTDIASRRARLTG